MRRRDHCVKIVSFFFVFPQEIVDNFLDNFFFPDPALRGVQYNKCSRCWSHDFAYYLRSWWESQLGSEFKGLIWSALTLGIWWTSMYRSGSAFSLVTSQVSQFEACGFRLKTWAYFMYSFGDLNMKCPFNFS